MHVREQVIPDEQDLIGCDAEVALHESRVTAEKRAAGSELERRPQVPFLVEHLEQGAHPREEVGLAGGHHHHLEQVTPGHAFGQEPVERVAHHGRGVRPLRIGDQQQLLARLLLVQQRERRLRVQLDEPVRIVDDLRLEHPLEMGLVDQMPYPRIEIRVAHHLRQLPRVQQVHELGIHAGLGQREQRVEELVALPLVEIDDRLGVHAALGVEVHGPRAVVRALDVSEPVGLDDVAQLHVDDQAADDERGIERQGPDRPAQIAQLLPEVGVRPLLPLLHAIVDQRVVHVVADGTNRPEVERTVAVDPANAGWARDERQGIRHQGWRAGTR